MTEPSSDAWTRATRLVRWYPAEWRTRYGVEFTELLAAQIDERPRSWALTFNVAFGAIMARVASLGLSGTTVDPSDQPRRSLATLSGVLAIFLTFALSIWSHLSAAQRWGTPATNATHTAINLMTVAVTICAGAVLVGAILIAWAATRAVACRCTPRLRTAVLMFVTGAAILIAGSIAFHTGWSGSGNHSQQSMGPSGPAGLAWASTLAISAYWAHPTILLSLPASEIAWMVISAVALVLASVGATKTVRQLELSSRLLRFITRTGQLAVAGLGLFVFGTLIWLVDGGPGPARLFQAGAVDQVGMVVMSVALLLAIRSIQRTGRRASLTQ